MNDKNFKRHMAYEALVILGLLALLTYMTRLWPILLLVILGIFIATLRLLFLSSKKVEPVKPTLALPTPSQPPVETDMQSMNFAKTAPVTEDMKTMCDHYKVVGNFFGCLIQERQQGLPADEKLRKQRDTALNNYKTVYDSFCKQFKSFKPATPEAYRAAITKMINTILPAWLQ